MAPEKTDLIGVARVYYLCPVCEEPVEDQTEILLNTRLTAEHANKVKALDGKPAGYAKKICSSCHDKIGDGIYLVGVIEQKTDDPKNPYRSGNIIGIKRQAFERIFDQRAPDGQVCWAEDQIITWIQSQQDS
jgi:hypothetical protein